VNYKKVISELLDSPDGRAALAQRLNLGFVEDAPDLPSPAKVCILIPSHRGVPRKVEDALKEMVAYTRQFCQVAGPYVELGSLVHEARNRLLSKAWRSSSQFTHFLFVDDDMVPPPDALVKLLRREKSLVGGLYVTRAKTPTPVALTLDPQGQMRPLPSFTPGELVEVEGMGAGLMLVSRECVQAVADYFITAQWEQKALGIAPSVAIDLCQLRGDRWQELKEALWFRFLPSPSGTEFGEDVSFCIAARDAGHVPYVDTDVVAGHLGEYVYTLKDIQQGSRKVGGGPVEFVTEEIAEPSAWCPDAKLWRAFDTMSAEVEVLEFLAACVRVLKPKLVIDTGSFEGWSATYMGRALKENGRGRLITVEIDPELHAKTVARIKAQGLEQVVECRLGSSLDIEGVEPVGLLFSDSAIEIRMQELEHFRPRLSSGSLVAVHDVMVAPQLLEGLKGLDWLTTLALPTPRGLAIGMLR
jgi:hypothetical protein